MKVPVFIRIYAIVALVIGLTGVLLVTTPLKQSENSSFSEGDGRAPFLSTVDDQTIASESVLKAT